jgi:hypothetical protein
MANPIASKPIPQWVRCVKAQCASHRRATELASAFMRSPTRKVTCGSSLVGNACRMLLGAAERAGGDAAAAFFGTLAAGRSRSW